MGRYLVDKKAEKEQKSKKGFGLTHSKHIPTKADLKNCTGATLTESVLDFWMTCPFEGGSGMSLSDYLKGLQIFERK